MMRRLRSVLLASTALTVIWGAPVEAGPVAPLAIAIGASVAGTAVAGAVGSAILGAALGGVVSVGIGVLGQQLFGPSQQSAPPTALTQQARLVNFAQPDSYFEYVLGRTRKGGPIVFTGSADSVDVATGIAGRKRHVAVILASHPISGVVQHWLDERIVTLDGDGLVTNTLSAGYGRIRTYNGTPSQAADAELVNSFPEWTTAHDMTGLAYAAFWALSPPPDAPFIEIYPRGREWNYSAVLEGYNNVFDPRTGTTGFTQNAGLLIAHVITQIFGQAVDWDAVAIEADASDAKWGLNGILSADMDHEAMRAAMMTACDGFWFERTDGKVGFYVGRWLAPQVTLTPDDYLDLDIRMGVRDGETPTEVTARYIDPGNSYRDTISGAFVFDAGAFPRGEEIPAPLVNSDVQAARVCKRWGLLRRSDITLSATIGLAGYELWAGRDGGPERFFLHQGPIAPGQYFEIDQLEQISANQFRLEARAVEPSDFDFTGAEVPPSSVRSTINSDSTVPIISGVSAAATGEGAFEVNWNLQPAYLGQQVRFRRVGASNWETYNVPAGQIFASITGQATGAGAQIELQARNVTRSLSVSAWRPATPLVIDVAANTVAPAALSSFAATVVGLDIEISLTAAIDANQSGVRIYRAGYPNGFAGSPEFASASLLATIALGSGASTTWTDVGPVSAFYAYWAEPFNTSGVSAAGNRSGPETAEIT